MMDVCLTVRDITESSPLSMPSEWDELQRPVLATIHRAENTDDPDRLRTILDGLANVSAPVLLVAHPRLLSKAETAGLDLRRDGVTPISSLTYSQMVYATAHAQGVITDSGGLQKEAYILRTPAVTVRTETEWPETLEGGWNVLSPTLEIDAVAHFEQDRPEPVGHPFGRGDAAQRTVEVLAN
jgi:UDP-N-acetylglucosamine 2-epimerase (non-hydrolysing)